MLRTPALPLSPKIIPSFLMLSQLLAKMKNKQTNKKETKKQHHNKTLYYWKTSSLWWDQETGTVPEFISKGLKNAVNSQMSYPCLGLS